MDVQAMHARFGNYALANVFSNNDVVGDLPDTEAPIYHAAFEDESGTKLHAACDECRKRKLKCSGEFTGCARCVKQSLTCQYSKQAPMGRPRKRRKPSEDADVGETVLPQPLAEASQPQAILPDFTKANARSEFESVCVAPIARYVNRKTPAPSLPFVTQSALYEHSIAPYMANSNDGTPPTDSPPTPVLSQQDAPTVHHFTDASTKWPDYTTMTMLPMIVQDNHPDTSSSEYLQSLGSTEPIQVLPEAPACACLPNLYLTLSSLHTLNEFPTSIHTIESLQTAHRTASAVLYCRICPTKFQSGMQNVMLSGTLLTVLADKWQRVQTAPIEELRRGFSPPHAASLVADSSLTTTQALEWRIFAYYLLRANVFGDKLTPCPPCQVFPEHHSYSTSSPDHEIQPCQHLASIDPCRGTPTLQSLVDVMERRQSFWHGKIPDTGEFLPRMSGVELQEYMRGLTAEQLKGAETDEQGHLCIKMVQNVRAVLKAMDRPEPTLL